MRTVKRLIPTKLCATPLAHGTAREKSTLLGGRPRHLAGLRAFNTLFSAFPKPVEWRGHPLTLVGFTCESVEPRGLEVRLDRHRVRGCDGPMQMPCLFLIGLFLGGAVSADSWKLVWSDEFDQDGAPDPAKWTYEEGFVRNRELQFYTKGRTENARVQNGNLILEARHEEFPNPRYQADAPERRWQQNRQHAEYTSASLTTRGVASWTYGKIEVRAKLPSGRGTWPAIWTLGTNISEVGWPACGEIDIMEHVGHEPDAVHANVHTRGYNHNRGNGRGQRLALPRVEQEFYVYAVEWSPEKLVFLVDHKPFFTLENDGTGVDSWPFDAPQYLILNLAVGGSWGGAQGVDADVFPQRYIIDYVRVYQQP